MFKYLLPLFFLPSLANANSCINSILDAQINRDWVYQVSYKGMQAEGLRRLTQSQNEWVLDQALSILLVSLNETSRMRLQNTELRTLSYVKEQKGLGARVTKINIDPLSGSVVSERKKKVYNYESKQPLLDPLGHSLQLQLDLSCGRAKEQVRYLLANTRSVKEYVYLDSGSEKLNTPWGERTSVRWSREEGDVRDTLWFVPDENYALVRVEHVEKGESSTLVLTDIR